MLVRIGTVQGRQSEITALLATALGVQLLDMNLAHIGVITDVGLPVVRNLCLGIDPPVGVGTLDSDLAGSVGIDHRISLPFT